MMTTLFRTASFRRQSRATLPLVGFILASVVILANCGRKTDGPTGNSSSYPGNFLALCHQQDKSAGLKKTFEVLKKADESCLDAHTRLMALDEIDLSGKGISDIRPLASFIGVKTLYLDHNRISSVAPLEGLYKLEKLDVSWNGIDSVKELAKLTRLDTLYVFGNPLGSDVAKTADNCPYTDVAKGLQSFCQPPKKKRPKVVVIKKNKSSTKSRTKRSQNKKNQQQDDSTSSDSSSSSTSDSTADSSADSSTDDAQAESSTDDSANDSETAKPAQKTPKAKTAEKATAKADKAETKKKRAWEKDPSFLPPENDDQDDWEEEVDRGLAPDDDQQPKASPDVDEAMAKEADKTLGQAKKPQTGDDQAQAQAQAAPTKAATDNPFALATAKTPAGQAGKQTTAHSWDQAMGLAFEDQADSVVAGPQELGLDLSMTGLGPDASGRRVPAAEIFGDAAEPTPADDSLFGSLTKLYPRKKPAEKAQQDDGGGFWTMRLFKSLSLGLGGGKKAQKPSAKAAKVIAKSAKVKQAKQKAVSQGWAKTTIPAAKSTREADAPIKSFLAYCLDHSDQPAIAHTIRVLTRSGETCIDSFRRLSNLKHLNLAKRQLTDIAPLASFKNLEKLDLSDNAITSLKPLVGLQKLTWLNVDRNKLGDISHLSRLAALSHLTAEHNRIFSLKPLGQLKNLGTIAVKGNPIATDAVKNSITCPVSAASSSLKSFCQM